MQTTTAGRGDDFTATTTCGCGWTHTEHLADDGDFAATMDRAEDALHTHTHTLTTEH